MNFKRILAGVMSGVTAVSLAACSNSSTSDSGAGSSDTTNTSTETTVDDEAENSVSVGDISIDAGEEVEPEQYRCRTQGYHQGNGCRYTDATA